MFPFLFKFLLPDLFLDSELLFVGSLLLLDQSLVLFPLGLLLLPLLLEVFFHLPLDELSLEHVLLHLLHVVQFELMQLIFDQSGIVELLFVLLLQVLPGLFVLLSKLLLLKLIPLLLPGLLSLLLSPL